MHPIPVLSASDWLQREAMRSAPERAGYYAFFSSLVGGITTDPARMQTPVDDHLVHRGDGVFETLKCVDGGIYLLAAHLDRLFLSAGAIGIEPPWTRDEIAAATVATVRAGGRRDALIRVLLSRGPGSLGVNPYDCRAPALYILAHELKPSFMQAHPGGARVGRSAIPLKPGMFATIKSCNYLTNALMKKEAVDRGLDFTVSFDEHGFLAEGATENIGIVTAEGRLLVPAPGRILQGTTMRRALDLACDLVSAGDLRGVSDGAIRQEEIAAAREVLIFGTTPDVTAVVEFDGRAVGDGRPGRIAHRLGALLEEDIRRNPASRTPVWP